MQHAEHDIIKQTDPWHPLYGHAAFKSHLKSRSSFIISKAPCTIKQSSNSLAKGHDLPWKQWQCFYRLKSGMVCCKYNLMKWWLSDDDKCSCSQIQTMDYILQCPPTECTFEELCSLNPHAMECKKKMGWHHLKKWHEQTNSVYNSQHGPVKTSQETTSQDIASQLYCKPNQNFNLFLAIDRRFIKHIDNSFYASPVIFWNY
jgi:hypothetical protein